MRDSGGVPEGPLEDLAYLSRSKSRIDLLNTLSVASHTRGELEAETRIPRTTIDRVVNELEERDWVRRTRGGVYEATPAGKRISAEITRAVGSMQAIRHLAEAVAWLPDDELTIGLHHFNEATVRRPESNDMSAPTTFATDLVQEATEFLCLVNTPPSLAFEDSLIEGQVAGRLKTEHVINKDGLDVLKDDRNRASRWATYMDAGATVHRYDGRIPCNLLVVDESVLILDRQPAAVEGIECTESAVRLWARGIIDEYRARAERVSAAEFR